jgi:hypothetical protein
LALNFPTATAYCKNHHGLLNSRLGLSIMQRVIITILSVGNDLPAVDIALA